MDQLLTEDQLKSFLSKEWLVKVDPQTSVPYLFKFLFSRVDLSCIVLITDTKAVWTEALNSQRFARRWRSCNSDSLEPHTDEDEEDAWRETNLEVLSEIHTLGGIPSVSFEVIQQSKFSDLALELECDACKWRWEVNSVGYRSSAEIISKHLIFPLITANHLGFSSPDPLSEMSDNDVEKAVDKAARTGRRAVDTHVKTAFSRPKFATALRRITAMFNFAAELPAVSSVIQTPDLTRRIQAKQHSPIQHPSPPPVASTKESPRTKAPVQTKGRLISKPPSPPRVPSPSPPRSDVKSKSAAMPTGSETEDDEDEDSPVIVPEERDSGQPHDVDARMQSPVPPPVKPSPPPQPSRGPPSPQLGSKSTKKPRLSPSTDSDSDGLPSQMAGSRVPAKRGAKQPIKRGGRRF